MINKFKWLLGFMSLLVIVPEANAILFDVAPTDQSMNFLGILFGVIGILTSPILMALINLPTIVIHQYPGI